MTIAMERDYRLLWMHFDRYGRMQPAAILEIFQDLAIAHAEELGIGRSAYANYEAGERETPLEVLERSASLLGCELELLFEPDVETVKDRMMVCAFRTDGLTQADMKEVARFKQVVLEYMKMQKMLEE